MIGLQITELKTLPNASLLSPVQNPPAYRPPLRDWIMTDYCGNKPSGGLWTSSYTPDDAYPSDWQRAIATNAAVQLTFAAKLNTRGTLYSLSPLPSARVLTISTMAEAVDFTQAFRLQRAPLPNVGVLSILLTPEITHWEVALREIDGIHLTAQAADEIAYHIDKPTAFHTWNAESTLWGKWVFESVNPLGDKA